MILLGLVIMSRFWLQYLNKSEAVVRRCSLKWVFLKVSLISQKTHVLERLQHRFFPLKFTKFLRTRFFYGTPPVAASDK